MFHHASSQTKKGWYWPPVGQRIIKTSVAVFICLIVNLLRGYRGASMSAEAAITAIICMQPYVQDTKEYALNRLLGTLNGAFWGLAFLLLLMLFPALGATSYRLYPLMALGILVALYSAVLLKKPDASSLSAIVFICIVIAYPDIDQPLQSAFRQVLDVMVGMAAAIGVNVFRLPRVKRRNKVFFLRSKDLSPDQLTHVSSAVLFRLNYLFNDGAKICLMSEHAPAFLMSQISSLKVNVPLIVMDGAAIYDANENTYLSSVNLDPAASRWLMKRLDALDIHYFVYTIHKNRNCIYHHGSLTESEMEVYRNLKRSPYRHYLDDERYDLEDVVYIKVVAADEKAQKTQRALLPSLAKRHLRTVLRPQAGLPGSSSLYFYAENADMAHAEERLMRLLKKLEPDLEAEEVFSATGYRSDHDATHLIHTLSNCYEPFHPLEWLREKRKKKKQA